MHIIGERLLLDERFLRDTVQEELGTLVERAKRNAPINPFTPEIMQEVLSQSAPQQDYCSWADLSLSPILLQHLCDYEFCANMDFLKCNKCFELDGAFAAELMMYMARQLVWAEELWGRQTESVVYVVDKELELAEEEGNLQALVKEA